MEKRRRRSTAKVRKASHLRLVDDRGERGDDVPCTIVVPLALALPIGRVLILSGARDIKVLPVAGSLELALTFGWPRSLVDSRGVAGVQTLLAAMVEAAALRSGLLNPDQAAITVAEEKVEVVRGQR